MRQHLFRILIITGKNWRFKFLYLSFACLSFKCLVKLKDVDNFFVYDSAELVWRFLIPFVLMVVNSGLLWHRLMGKVVLNVESHASPFLRSYAHCSKGRVSQKIFFYTAYSLNCFALIPRNHSLKMKISHVSLTMISASCCRLV